MQRPPDRSYARLSLSEPPTRRLRAGRPRVVGHSAGNGAEGRKRSSRSACRTTTTAPCRARLAMIAATATSGHPVPVPNTPSAAARTRKVSEHVIPRANPRRAHIRIAAAVGPQKGERGGVRDQCGDAHGAHGESVGKASVPGVPTDHADHPRAEYGHARALEQRRKRAIAQRHADDKKADGVVRGIAEKVQGIRQQRCRPRREAGADLDGEHRGVDREDKPQDPPVRRVPGAIGLMAVVAARVSPVADIGETTPVTLSPETARSCAAFPIPIAA
jgi:hypothetical protein